MQLQTGGSGGTKARQGAGVSGGTGEREETSTGGNDVSAAQPTAAVDGHAWFEARRCTAKKLSPHRHPADSPSMPTHGSCTLLPSQHTLHNSPSPTLSLSITPRFASLSNAPCFASNATQRSSAALPHLRHRAAAQRSDIAAAENGVVHAAGFRQPLGRHRLAGAGGACAVCVCIQTCELKVCVCVCYCFVCVR
jgi:hypothetical protein